MSVNSELTRDELVKQFRIRLIELGNLKINMAMKNSDIDYMQLNKYMNGHCDDEKYKEFIIYFLDKINSIDDLNRKS